MSGGLVVLALVCQAASLVATVAPPTSTSPSPTPSTALSTLATTSTGNQTVSSARAAATPFNASLLPDEPWFPYRPLLVDCFPRLSWPCAQTKLLLYMDQLNRARRVRILGDLVTLEKTRPDQTPPLTEELLTARHIRDQASLLSLLELVTDRFLDTHVIRLDLPSWDGARLVSDPIEISFVVDEPEDSPPDTGDRQGRGKKGGGKKKKKMKGGKKMMKMMMGAGKKMVEMIGKMMMGKMMLMVPIAMKKGMIGGMAGLMSMGMMKFMLLQKVISLLKSKCGGGGGGGGGGDECGGGGGGGGCGGGGGGGCDSGGGGGYGRIEWARTDAYHRGGYPTVAAPVASHPYYQHPQPPYAYDYWRQQPKEDKTWTLWR